MSKPIDMTGQRFGRLTVIEKSYKKDASNGLYWLCKCDCGQFTVVSGDNLRRGLTSSCGCKRSDVAHNLLMKLNGGDVRKKIEEVEAEDDAPLVDDDLWMFGNHQAIKRLQKMFH